MDLNDLYHRHQVSLYRAKHGASAAARKAHLGMADGYAERIARLRRGRRQGQAR
jgi:hypothetical protein